MTTSAHFTDAALALVRQTQSANMPDRVYVLTRTITRAPGGVATEVFTIDRVEPCRLSRAAAIETARATSTGERVTHVVARPYDATSLDGTERLVVLVGDGIVRRRFSLTVRSIGARPLQSFDTVQLADVTSDGVAQVALATSATAFSFSSSGSVTLS